MTIADKEIEAVDVRGIALQAIKECRRAGESQEMLARWISERVNAAVDTYRSSQAPEDDWSRGEVDSDGNELITVRRDEYEALLNPPKHKFWGAGEPDCPREIKAGNGELHTLRCKVCGKDNPRDDRCLAVQAPDVAERIANRMGATFQAPAEDGLVERLKELLAKATPGPWKFVPWHVEEGPAAVRAPAGWLLATTSGDMDAQLIAEAINALPALLDEILILRSRCDGMKAALEPFVAVADKRDAVYRKRGGNPDAFPDTHPAYDIVASELPAGVWRKARTALGEGKK